MAAATITSQRWGYKATGGVDQTTICATPVRIKAVVVQSVGTAAGLATLSTVTGTVGFGVFSGGSIGISASYFFGDKGVELPDLAVVMGTTGHIVNVVIA